MSTIFNFLFTVIRHILALIASILITCAVAFGAAFLYLTLGIMIPTMLFILIILLVFAGMK